MQNKQEIKSKAKLIKSNIIREGMIIIEITNKKWETRGKQTSSQERNINKPHFNTFFFPSKNNFTQLILCSNYTLRQIL